MSESPHINNYLAKKILSWYEINKRDLPWRKTDNPYFIWLSEVILQQTKVTQGLPYYEKFVKNFPTLKKLSVSTESDILKLWQGLGYYSRARNMHYTARYICNELNGEFPDNYKELLKLKGIGDYTASAIASFAFGRVAPVLDGNVYRFISRYIGNFTPINTTKAQKEFKVYLNEIIDKESPGEFNQAIMEFGALQCIPKKPDCENCIFNDSCYAANYYKINELPVKLKKSISITRYFTYYFLSNKDSFLLKKRVGKGIWENLYEFPLSENVEVYKNELIDKNVLEIENMEELKVVKIIGEFKHILSHQNIYAKLIILKFKGKFNSKKYECIENKHINLFPMHRLMEKMIEKLEIE